MIAISCDNISLSFGADTVLDRITFSLNEGERLGIIGVNGAGKTSLFKIITGEYQSDAPYAQSSGIYVARGLTVGTLSQTLDFKSGMTLYDAALSTFAKLLADEAALEELRLAVEGGDTACAARYASAQERFTRDGGYEFRGRCRGILVNLGFSEELYGIPVTSMSGGQKTRLALACLLLRDPDILLLDEPTNHLDTDAMYWLEEYLKSKRKTVLVISHDRYFLDSVATMILELENTHGKLYDGNYTAAKEKKLADRAEQEKHYKLQQREIARIETYIEQQRRWNRERNIIAAESRQKQLDKMVRVDKPENLPDSVRMTFTTSGESGNDVVYLRSLAKGYGGEPLFEDVSLTVKKRERVFITGSNGCGKSTLIKLIAHKDKPDRGEVEYGYNVTVGYYDQENQQLNPDNTVLDELWDCYSGMTQTQIRSALALFLFKGDDIEKKVSVLSGGEKARLTLTKLILSKMNLLILDEPTNHLDINSREALESALEGFDGTIIAVSHDRYFINKLATRVLDFNAETERHIYDYRGVWDEYREYKAQYLIKDDKRKEAVVTRSKEEFLSAKQRQSEQRKYERRVRLNKEETEAAEKRLTEIEAEMNGEAASDHIRLAELYAEKETLEAKLLELYTEAEDAGYALF